MRISSLITLNVHELMLPALHIIIKKGILTWKNRYIYPFI